MCLSHSHRRISIILYAMFNDDIDVYMAAASKYEMRKQIIGGNGKNRDGGTWNDNALFAYSNYDKNAKHYLPLNSKRSFSLICQLAVAMANDHHKEWWICAQTRAKSINRTPIKINNFGHPENYMNQSNEQVWNYVLEFADGSWFGVDNRLYIDIFIICACMIACVCVRVNVHNNNNSKYARRNKKIIIINVVSKNWTWWRLALSHV